MKIKGFDLRYINTTNETDYDYLIKCLKRLEEIEKIIGRKIKWELKTNLESGSINILFETDIANWEFNKHIDEILPYYQCYNN